MKIILLDPSKKYYKSCLHTHSTNSDGKLTPEEVKNLYKSNGYSVVAYTDHEHLIDNSHLNDDDFLAITSCEIAIKDGPAELRPSLNKKMRVCHLNLYAKNPSNIDTPCYNPLFDYHGSDEAMAKVYYTCEPYNRIYSHEGISEIIRIANEKGFLVCYNHPRWSLESARDYLGYKGLWAVEIYNYCSSQEGLYEYDIYAYDDFLRDGQKIACVSTDDSHNTNTALGGWTMINAEKLDYETVIDAMEKHNFYSSTGPEIKELYIEENKAYITYCKGSYATMSTEGRRVSRINAENKNGENTAVFEFLPEDGYIRFDVIDKYGKRANTNAYFIEDLKK
ncbi:MAG: hypothetical protein IJA19_06795 [Clostridia bacterium]|nr:hypothetical protein [Clostridia bacterium]